MKIFFFVALRVLSNFLEGLGLPAENQEEIELLVVKLRGNVTPLYSEIPVEIQNTDAELEPAEPQGG
jgi:hypothetical protein